MISLTARALVARLDEWRSAAPAYRALADRIRLLILDGRIAVGTRLPAERELAAQLGVSRTTIAAAYAELRELGVLESTRGSGSIARLPAGRLLDHGIGREPHDLSKATMPASPRLVDAMRAAVERLPEFVRESGFDPVGLPVLRAAIAERYTARGLATVPEQIMVTIGAQHAMSLLGRTLLSRGDRVVIEHPTYPHAIDAFAQAGGRLIPVGVDAVDGWDAAALEQTVARSSPALAYLMPDNHNPTGLTMPAALLECTLHAAAAQGTTVVVDETMGELTLDGPNRPPAAALGPAVLLGSVGKTVWGGLRLGWIRAEPSLIGTLARARFANDLGTPIVDQLAVAELLPEFDAVLAERLDRLRAGRAHLLARLEERFPEWSAPVPHGGLTAWVAIGRPVSSQLALTARALGLVISAGPRFAIDGAFERHLRLPFSHPADVTDRALDVLAVAWRRIVSGETAAFSEQLEQVV